MAVIDLDATMDAIAAEIVNDGVSPRAYAWPVENIEVPCAVVGYPKEGDLVFDLTFQTAGGFRSDEATFPVWFVVGTVVGRASRKALSDIITGATGIKNALDGNLGGVVQTARVTECTIETVTVGTVEYLSARFDVEVAT